MRVATETKQRADFAGASIKAKTLILTGTKDLLNPEFEPTAIGKTIPDVRMVTISPGTVTGHASAGGGIATDVDFLNREVANFLGNGRASEAKRLDAQRRPTLGIRHGVRHPSTMPD